MFLFEANNSNVFLKRMSERRDKRKVNRMIEKEIFEILFNLDLFIAFA